MTTKATATQRLAKIHSLLTLKGYGIRATCSCQLCRNVTAARELSKPPKKRAAKARKR